MNRRILIADDEEFQLRFYRSILTAKQRDLVSTENTIPYELTLFSHGKPLIRFFREKFEKSHRIPLCILDMRMPGMDGLETAEALRQTDPDVFIIIVTALDVSHDEMIKSLTKDVYFMRKPVRIAEFLALVHSLIINWNNQQSLKKAIAGHKRTEELLKEKEVYLKAVMQAIQTGVMIIAPDTYKIIDANPWACEMLGYVKDDIVGHDFYDFLHHERLNKDPSLCPISNEYVLLKKNKEPIYTRRSVAKTRVKDKEYLVQSLLDITDIKNHMKKQEISIDLAKRLLNIINRGIPRYTPLSDDLVLFAHVLSAPCLKEGGDHSFVRSLSTEAEERDDKTVISLKDQSGHEVGCILRSIMTDLIHHGILNKCADIPLEELISSLNDEIHRSQIFRPGEFFTSVSAEIHHKTLTLTYLLNGHPRFFLIRGDEIRGLPEMGKPGRNFPIPMQPGTAYSSGTCRLREGDKLIFYTDGLTDMPMTRKNRVISFDGLKAIISHIVRHNPFLPVSHIMERLLSTVSEMSDEGPIPCLKNISHDDVTILCLEIENRKRYHEKKLRFGNSDDVSRAIEEMYQTISHDLKGRGFYCSELEIFSVLDESIVNAWKHGNGKDPHKTVTVRWRYGNDFHLEVMDEGDGFDFNNLPDPKSEESITRISGRGIYIMQRFSDMIHWKDGGKHLVLRLRKDHEQTKKEHAERIKKTMKLW